MNDLAEMNDLADRTLSRLPATRQELLAKRKLKTDRSLLDRVEGFLVDLWENDEFRRFLATPDNDQAVEGSLIADKISAAGMLRAKAQKDGDEVVGHETLAVLAKKLDAVLRRFVDVSRADGRRLLG